MSPCPLCGGVRLYGFREGATPVAIVSAMERRMSLLVALHERSDVTQCSQVAHSRHSDQKCAISQKRRVICVPRRVAHTSQLGSDAMRATARIHRPHSARRQRRVSEDWLFGSKRALGPRWAGCVPVLLSSRFGQVLGLGWLVGGFGFEHGEDDVAAASGDADDGGVVAFAFGSFGLVVGGAAGSCWVATKAPVNMAFLRRWLPPRGLRVVAVRPDWRSTGASAA